MSLYKAKVPHNLSNSGPILMALICKYITDEYETRALVAKKSKKENILGWSIFLSNEVIVRLISEYLLTKHHINVNKGIDGLPKIDDKGSFIVNISSAGKAILTNDLGLHVSPIDAPN